MKRVCYAVGVYAVCGDSEFRYLAHLTLEPNPPPVRVRIDFEGDEPPCLGTVKVTLGGKAVHVTLEEKVGVVAALDEGNCENGGFDLFVSYNRDNSPVVLRIVHALQERHVRVWLDRMDLQDGTGISQQIANAIEHSRAALVIVGEEGLGVWQPVEVERINARLPEMPCIGLALPGGRPHFLGGHEGRKDIRLSFIANRPLILYDSPKADLTEVVDRIARFVERLSPRVA